MNDHEDPEFVEAGHLETGAKQELLPPHKTSAGQRAWLPAPIRIAGASRGKSFDEPLEPGSTRPWHSRLAFAAAVATAAILACGAFWAINDHRSQAGAITRQTEETRTLTRTIDALSARLSVIETARSHDELVKLRQSVGEIRSSVASSRDLSGTIAQLAQRVDKLDREQSAKVDKLNERVDREAGAQSAEIAARIDKLEKKMVASPTPVQTAADLPAPPPKPAAGPLPKLGPSVSMETTGSIERSRPVLRGYIVLGARDDVALVEGRNGERAVRRGDFLPGAGRVQEISRAGGSWVVLTEQGQILAADEPH